MHDDFSPIARRSLSDFLHRRSTVFLVAYLGYASCYLVRNNVAVVSEILTRELQWTATQIGSILAGFTVSYGIGKLVMGVVVDRLSLRHTFAWALGVSAVLCLVAGLVRDPMTLTVILFLIGIAQGACAPAALAMIGSWYPTETRGSRVAIWNTSQNLGAAALPLVTAGGLAFMGPDAWWVGFFLPGVIALVVALWADRRGGDRPWQEGMPTLRSLYGPDALPRLAVPPEVPYWALVRTHVIGNHVLALLLLLNTLLYLLRFGILNWIPIYLIRERALPAHEATLAMSAFEWGAIPGALAFAVIATRRPNGTARAAAVAIGILAVVVPLYGGATTGSGVIAVALLLGALVYGPQVIVNILTLNFVSPRAIGVAVGWVGLGGYLVGAATANLAIPRLADSIGWGASFTVLSITAIICVGLCLRLHHYERLVVPG